MKGPLHDRLRAMLVAAIESTEGTPEEITQTSIAAAIRAKDPSSVGKYLKPDGTSGALDLDQADLVLHHIGSSLKEFMASAPPRPPSKEDLMARALLTRPVLTEVISDLIDAEKTMLPQTVQLIRDVARQAKKRRKRRTDESPSGSRAAAHTKSGPSKRR